jgi:hypothetical protein
MFELLKIMSDLVGKLVNPQLILKRKKKKRIAAIGRELFLCLHQLNEIIFTGYEILNDMEGCLRCPNWPESCYMLPFSLNVQMVNILRFGKTLEKLSQELNLIDSVAYQRLQVFYASKGAIIGHLSYMLRRGEFPLVVDERPLLELLSSSSKKEIGWLPEDTLCKFIDEWQNSTISASKLNKKAQGRIRAYLKEKQPQKQLKEMEDLSNKLHSTLKSHFDISEILMTLADLKKRGDYNE